MNHLVVGLGGTGGKVLAAFRRLIFQQYREVSPAELAIDYLYIDSSDEDVKNANINEPLKTGDQVWRTLGRSVQLSPAQIIHLKQGRFSQIIDNIDSYAAVKRWLGDTAIWRDIWNSAPNGIEAGGQLRRFGRFLFAQNAGEVVNALQDRFSAPGKRGVAESKWTVHVVAGLAGGTGSGTFLDLLGQIRKIRGVGEDREKDTKIILYAVLPETEQTSWAKENYYANGYAALAELNGLVVKAFHPSDPTELEGRYRASMPVNNVFVVTNRNENGLIVSMDKVLPEIMADTLFQIVVASGDARAINAADIRGGGADQRVWRDMVTGENDLTGYEKDVATGPDARANRFLTFGVKRVTVPHQEIKEYAALAFLRQSMLQLTHNNWGDGFGFVESQVRFDGAAIARADETREAWRLSDGHLMLERKSLENDSQDWRTLHEEFLNPLNTKADAIRRDVRSNDQWIQPLEAFASERYERTFRKVGVPEFYRVAERAVVDRAKLIRDRVADDLFGRWASGERSARDIQRILEELVADVQERLTSANQRIQENRRLETEKEEERKWSVQDYASFGGRGIIGIAIYSRPQALTRHARILAERYLAKTRLVAYEYMRKTLGAVLPEIQALLADVTTVAERLTKAVVLADQRREARIPSDEKAENSAHQFKFYDRDHVRGVVRRLELTKDVQKLQTDELRIALVKKLGARPSFRAFVDKMSESLLLEELESQAESQAESALAAMESERDRVLEASIFQRLYEEYSGRDEDLKRFIADRVREAGSFAQFAAHQIMRQEGNIRRQVVAFVPAAGELPNDELRVFRGKVVDDIRGSGVGASVEIVEVHDRRHEIVFLSLVNQFPIRYLQALEPLQQKYDALVTGAKGRRKRLELHTEDAELPGLYPPSIGETRLKMTPYWLIAECAEIIKERTNPATGKSEVFATSTDDDGVMRIHVFGDALNKGVAGLSLETAPALRSLVDTHLAGLIHVDDRNAMKQKLVARQNATLEAVSMNEEDPRFIATRDAVLAARVIAGL